ncbi:MAG: hypothetical protein GWP06_14425 [Actinobacteria bacterium]|nr:hypothetical protein [Actinomycetota bacterium]
MSIKFYMDHNIPRSITMGLRLCGVDVITAYEDHTSNLPDTELLDKAGALQRVLFTQDDDLLLEAAERQRLGRFFNVVIYAHQLRILIGACVKDLESTSKAGEPENIENKVIFLPLIK